MTPPSAEIRPAPAPSALRQAGVAASPLEQPHLDLREWADPSLLRLHSLEEPGELAARLADAGITLPPDTNGAAGDDPAALCLRPGEWLLIGGEWPVAEWIAQLEPRLDPSRTALVDLSDGLGAFRLRGTAAPWLLGKLGGLDFLAGIRSGQHGARTRIGEIAVVLHFRPGPEGEPCFDLLFDRSVAKYLWDLLNDAAPHAAELYDTHGAAA